MIEPAMTVAVANDPQVASAPAAGERGARLRSGWRAGLRSKTLTPERLGMVLGLLAVIGFSATLPATRIAVHYLDPTVVGLGRSIVAALLGAILLAATRARSPTRQQIKSLLVVASGVIVGFPLLSAWAMQRVPAAHAAIVVAILPLFTAVAGALRMHQRPSRGFWIASIAGSLIVMAFVLFTSHASVQRADNLLALAALLGAVGYAEGGRLARELGGWQVICWALVITAPFLLLPVGIAVQRHGVSAPLQAWLAFGYVSVVSQLLAFFLWYHGMALGGIVRVSQMQLLQVFFSMGIAATLLGETITPLMLLAAALVAVVLAVSRRMPIVDAAGANADARNARGSTARGETTRHVR